MPEPKNTKPGSTAITQFARKLESRTATSADHNAFANYRARLEREAADPTLIATCDELLAKYQQVGPSRDKRSTDLAPPARTGGGRAPTKADNSRAAPATLFGQPFHNPYTFMPFGTSPRRHVPTPLTLDETDPTRFTGVFELEIRTLSPLLSVESPARKSQSAEPSKVLRIGNDAIVPATGIKGALRSLMTMLVGGSLGYVDDSIWLCQGRDMPLGPRSERAPRPEVPRHAFLARVIKPGTATTAGEIRVAKARLISIKELETKLGDLGRRRPTESNPQAEIPLGPGEFVKLSGRRVNNQGVQCEGVYNDNVAFSITLPPHHWKAYLGRHRHGMRKELRKGDLVWVQPTHPDLDAIRTAEDVASLQWSRWGREGSSLLELLRKEHPAMVPDAFRSDGMVDEVTDLFGHVPLESKGELAELNRGAGTACAFAARLRPDNLVFRDAVPNAILPRVDLAPMANPHPGCLGFYRRNADADEVCRNDPLRGYKVYRTTDRHGAEAPWHRRNQPVFDGAKASDKSAMAGRSVDLIRHDCLGTLRIAARSLSAREVALVLLACSVDWRLGGGKPLGLGHCRVTRVKMRSERGKTTLDWKIGDETAAAAIDRPAPASFPSEAASFLAEIDDTLRQRAGFYQATQRPVDLLRYPRAVTSPDNFRQQRGGHVWFQRHCMPKKGADAGAAAGLEVRRIDRALTGGPDQVRAQPLPDFDPANHKADVLYGYDVVTEQTVEHRQSVIRKIMPFTDDMAAATAGNRRDPTAPASPNAQSRRDQREGR
jgi:hypothetical protein